MINFISGILGGIIRVIYNLVGNNYLIALLIFTFLTKLILFPLMLKQLKSTAGIQKIAPEDKKLREKYKDNPVKLNEELTKLYAENKISPMAGCLLPIIQIPIILAMFFVVKQPLTYIAQMDQTEIKSYTAQYLQKEEVTDNEAKAYEINIAKEYDLLDMNIGNKISLGDTPKDAFSKDETRRVSKWTLSIPILTLLFSLLSNQISMRKSKQTMTEDQAEMQKSMNIMMPILSAYFAYAWPLALGVYWLFGTILGIGQQLLIDKLMEDKENSNKEKKDNKKNKVLFLGKGENND
ncbi:MAG: YidC/Oxa1 family membrane protein insertase [Clostridia bacterium]